MCNVTIRVWRHSTTPLNAESNRRQAVDPLLLPWIMILHASIWSQAGSFGVNIARVMDGIHANYTGFTLCFHPNTETCFHAIYDEYINSQAAPPRGHHVLCMER